MLNHPLARHNFQNAVKKLASARLNSLRDMQAGKYPVDQPLTLYRIDLRIRPFITYDLGAGNSVFNGLSSFPTEYFEFANDPSTISHVKRFVYEMHITRDYYILEAWRMRYTQYGKADSTYTDLRKYILEFKHHINMFEARLQKLGHPTARQQRLEILKRERLGTQV